MDQATYSNDISYCFEYDASQIDSSSKRIHIDDKPSWVVSHWRKQPNIPLDSRPILS